MFLAQEQGTARNSGAFVGYIFTVMVKRRSTEAVSLTEPSFAYPHACNLKLCWCYAPSCNGKTSRWNEWSKIGFQGYQGQKEPWFMTPTIGDLCMSMSIHSACKPICRSASHITEIPGCVRGCMVDYVTEWMTCTCFMARFKWRIAQPIERRPSTRPDWP